MTADGLAATARRAPDPSPVAERYVARVSGDECTIYDEAADGLERMETWISADWWLNLEDMR
jgi:hypothetical protein